MDAKKKIFSDCRECPNFLWDFEEGCFVCVKARDRQVEDLHLVPDWCPLADVIWSEASSQSLDASCY